MSEFPLPAGVPEPEVFGESVAIDGLQPIELAGVMVQVRGEPVTGSAAALGRVPWERAYFELLERLSIVGSIHAERPLALKSADGRPLGEVLCDEAFPSSGEAGWNYARSNGAAIAPSWEQACERALGEAVERDAVLRSWYGELALSPLPDEQAELWRPLRGIYELELRCVEWLGFVVTVGVGFPRSDEVPTCIAFGARRDAAASNAAAHGEFIQRLGFLWGEEIPTSEPTPEPNANYHQEYYLWRESGEHLRRWLAAEVREQASAPSSGPRGFADLTPPELEGKAAAARVIHPGLWPLTFGTGHVAPSSRAPVHLVHPIA